jgi:hypothetical protein
VPRRSGRWDTGNVIHTLRCGVSRIARGMSLYGRTVDAARGNVNADGALNCQPLYTVMGS